MFSVLSVTEQKCYLGYLFYLYIILNILYYCCSLLLLHSDCTYFMYIEYIYLSSDNLHLRI